MDKPSLTNRQDRPVTPKKIKGVTVEVDMNTNNLSAKLKAIAKHAEALANELDSIDAAKCPSCGSPLDITELYADGKVFDTSAYCGTCRD